MLEFIRSYLFNLTIIVAFLSFYEEIALITANILISEQRFASDIIY